VVRRNNELILNKNIMENTVDKSWEVAKKFVKEVLPFYDKEGSLDAHQITTSLHPYIANAVYENKNIELEAERMKTLIALARVLDDENIGKAITALKFQITLKK